MSSTQQLAAGYISDGDLLESEAQTALEQIVSITKELFGGTEEGTAISIASGAFAVQANVSHYFIDTEAAAASDDLQYVSGTPRAGQLIAIRSVNSARIITIVNGAGGAGQILTKNGSNFVLGYGQFAIFKYVSGSPGYWEEWLRDDLARIDQMLGARPATTLTVASSAVAASRARHLIDSTTTTNLDFITTANLVDGTIIFIMTANATYVRTMRHNIAGTGKFNLIGGASIIMAANTHYGFVKNGSQWDHVMTLNAVPAVVPVSTAAGKMLIGGASGDWVESGGTLAKGSIPAGSSGTAFGYLGVGTNGQVITADSAETLGIKWATSSAGGGLYGDGADGAKTISSNTTETVPKIFRLTTLTINTGVTWTVKSGTLILCTGAVDIQGTGQLVVAADIAGGVGATAASSPSLPFGQGPSPGGGNVNYSRETSCGGGGCGGNGGNGGIDTSFTGGGAGGRAILPMVGATGSGGGAGNSGNDSGVSGNGGAGGGLAGLYSGSTIAIAASAKITANGGAGSAQSGTYGQAGGGGSGGIWDIGALTSITNSGTIEAKGGAGGNAVNSGYYGAGGGGGIVCLTSASITAGTITLTGGAKGSGGAGFATTDATAGSTGVTYSTTAVPVKYRCF